MTVSFPASVQFGPFELSAVKRELRKNGLRVKLTPHEMSLLCFLVEPPLRVRTREEIQRRLWPPSTFVDFEHGMNKIVHSLREALGDSATNPRFIETVNATGYRFIPQWLQAAIPDRNDFPKRIAVLPIMTTDSDGLFQHCRRIACRLIDGLSAIGQLRVMAEATVNSYRIDVENPQQAGQVLGIDAVISGELTRMDEAIFLRTELIDVVDGSQLCGAYAESAKPSAADADRELAEDVLKQLLPCLLHSMGTSNSRSRPSSSLTGSGRQRKRTASPM